MATTSTAKRSLLIPLLPLLFLIAACSSTASDGNSLAQRLATVTHPPEIASVIEGAEIADETYDIPARLQQDGEILVLWYGGQGFLSGNSAVVVYKENDGRLIPLRACRVPDTDIYDSGKNADHHRITNAIDDKTTSIYCETKEEATQRGRPNPMLIIRGESGGFLGLFGKGDPTYREFGIL